MLPLSSHETTLALHFIRYSQGATKRRLHWRLSSENKLNSCECCWINNIGVVDRKLPYSDKQLRFLVALQFCARNVPEYYGIFRISSQIEDAWRHSIVLRWQLMDVLCSVGGLLIFWNCPICPTVKIVWTISVYTNSLETFFFQKKNPISYHYLPTFHQPPPLQKHVAVLGWSLL